MGHVDSTLLYGEIQPTDPAHIARVRAILPGHPHEADLLEALGLA